MTAIVLCALILGDCEPLRGLVEDHQVDLIERNRYVGFEQQPDGKWTVHTIFVQWLPRLWHKHPTTGEWNHWITGFHVERQGQVRESERSIVFFVGNRLIRIRARRVEHTIADFDREVEERDVLPMHLRRGPRF